jgi:serine/threonine-protein kinase
LNGGLALVLRRWRTISLAGLRWIEWAVFAPPVLFYLWNGYYDLQDSLPEIRAGVNRLTISMAVALPFVLLIVVYGVFIPNTWRRCGAATGLIGAVVVARDAWVLLTGDVPSQHSSLYLANLSVWLGAAIAIVIYGAHRIEVLQAEAVEARKLGQYLIKDRLGAGGMGEVYLAEHLLLRRPCAIKLIRPERAGDAKTLLRFEREVQTTATLTHPNTVQVFDYGHAADGTFYYVMEYLPGLTLEQMVHRHGPLPPSRAVHLLRQVCGALQEAHAVGLIHRDIKPGNVMVCERGGLHDTVKLLDFGLVREATRELGGDGLTQEGAVAGTPAYLSPEQASGGEGLDARSDLYGMGALAYFLLTGQPPFAGRSTVKVLAAHLYEVPVPPTHHRPDVPEDLETIVLRCLAKDPAERFPDAEALEAALAACRCAGQWSGKDAAAWWRSRMGQSEKVGIQGETQSLR